MIRKRLIIMATSSLSILSFLTGCIVVPPTVEYNSSLTFVEIDHYKFHVKTFGDEASPPLIVVHGGPGADSKYLYPIKALSKNHYVIFYDQRGTGLSQRVDKKELTLESSLNDLHKIVNHYGRSGKVKLIGHSWGGMLVVGYLALHPDLVSHAVVVEPGILNTNSAKEFVSRFKASQSFLDALPLLQYIAATPFVKSQDGHERFDYVMTRLMNRAKSGGPYQCKGESMPENAFERAGYDAFDSMLKPVLDDPTMFATDLTKNIKSYKGKLLMISSECSFIGFQYQQKLHIPLLPLQTVHLQAEAMGHNMLTLNPEWSVLQIESFLNSM